MYIRISSASLPEKMHSDPVHYYTPEATEAFTKQVLSFILPKIGITKEVEYCEDMYVEKPIGI